MNKILILLPFILVMENNFSFAQSSSINIRNVLEFETGKSFPTFKFGSENYSPGNSNSGWYAKSGSHIGMSYNLLFNNSGISISTFYNVNEIGTQNFGMFTSQASIVLADKWTTNGFFIGPCFERSFSETSRFYFLFKVQGGPILLTFPKVETLNIISDREYRDTYSESSGTGLGGRLQLGIACKVSRILRLVARAEIMTGKASITTHQFNTTSGEGYYSSSDKLIEFDQSIGNSNVSLGVSFNL